MLDILDRKTLHDMAVRAMELNGRLPGILTDSTVAPTAAPCRGCTGQEEWPAEIIAGVADPIPDPSWGDDVNRAYDDDARARHVAALHRLIATDFPGPAKAEGDGIVTVGGGKYWPGIVVGVRMLRETGSTLPVQIWHRACESVNPADLKGVEGVSFHDADDVLPPMRWSKDPGWQQKTVALLHCGFRRVLYLDADAYCVADPAPLLALADKHPFVFWGDYPHMEVTVDWPWYGLPSPPAPLTVQGGQLIFNRPAFWRQIVLAHWLNRHSDYFYHHAYGDQDQWRVALAAAPANHLDLGQCQNAYPAFAPAHRGVTYVVHRCNCKLGVGGADEYVAHLPKEGRAHHWLNRLYGDGGPERAFARKYLSGEWSPDGGSGTGSKEPEARPYLTVVNALVGWHGWKRVVDLGSGDGWVASQITAPEVVGAECVRAKVDECRRKWPRVEWHHLDLDKDRERLPAGDVALLKDVLHHTPEAFVRDWLAWARACGKWRYVLLTQDNYQHHPDCAWGGYRGLDIKQEPLRGVEGLRELTRYLHKSVLLLKCEAQDSK